MSRTKLDGVEVRLSRRSSNVEPFDFFALEITDRSRSGIQIIEVRLTPEEVANLFSARSATGSAEVLSPEVHARIGKVYVHQLVELPEEVKHHSTAVYDANQMAKPDQFLQAYREAVLSECASEGWEGADWRRHNYGWSLTLWRYEEVGSDVD